MHSVPEETDQTEETGQTEETDQTEETGQTEERDQTEVTGQTEERDQTEVTDQTEEAEEAEETESALVQAVRHGDVDAVLMLWRRHSERARACAGRHTVGPLEADRVLRRAFARVISEIASDDDRAAPFLLSLYLGVEAEAEAEAGACRADTISDHPLVLAFQTLRRTYQTLLWHLAVEPLPAAALAAVLDRDEADLVAMSRHALTVLRMEWVAEVVADPAVGDSCAWVLLRVDAFAAGILGDLSAQRYGRHLRGCALCRSTVDDLGQPLEVLRRLIYSATEISTVETDSRTTGPRTRIGGAP